jgi:preprotein translocase subunit SecF
MELISSKLNVDYLKLRFVFYLISATLFIASIFIWVTSGPSKYGVDFLGGAEVVVAFSEPVKTGEVRDALNKAGFSTAIVQSFEEHLNEFSIRLSSADNTKVGDDIKHALESNVGKKFEVLKQDYVGPVVGEQIRRDGLISIVLSLIGILIYVAARFEWRFAVGAIAALVHDVIITSGIFIFSGRQISVGVLAALLTIIGYSLNDTIIIFDRLRENVFAALKKGSSKKDERLKSQKLYDIINLSINQTLSRTILTSLTTLFVVAALYAFGGGAISDLAFTLLIGIIIGTYSTLYIACAIVLWLNRR